MIMKLINKLKTIFMAKIDQKKFVPTPEEQRQGAVAMVPAEIVEALAAYKKQNPIKYEQKKEALFARYGLTPDAVVDEEPDANDLELEAIKKTVAKKTK
jgi:hypothetical protein